MDTQNMIGATMPLNAAVWAAGTTTTVSTTNAIDFMIAGRIYTHAALTNAATPTTDGNTGSAFTGVAVNQGSVFIQGFNAAGTLTVLQGSVEALDAAGNFITAPKIPALPADFCPCSTLIVKVGSTGSTWTYGSSNQASVTGVTYTRFDGMASRLVVA